MKKAVLILGDGTAIPLEGRFVLLSETAGENPELSVVRAYRNGAQRESIVFDTCVGAIDYIRERRRTI